MFSFQNTRVGIVPVTLPRDFILNSPFIIAAVTVFSCLIWLLVASAMAGEAAARDVQTGMHPLTYTSPVSKAEYLGGRFLAAFVLNALVLLGVQAGSLLAVYAPGIDPEIVGPFRPAAYLAAYAFIALPNAFIVAAIQFAFALLSGRAMAGYFASVLLLFLAAPVSLIVTFALGEPTLGKMVDPIGIMGIMNAMMLEWTIVEKNVRMFRLEGAVLWNRLLWLGIASAALGFVHLRFRFAHRAAADPWSRIARRFAGKAPVPDVAAGARVSGLRPAGAQVVRLQRPTCARRSRSPGRRSGMIARSPAGLFLLAAYPAMLVLVLRVESEHWGVPLLPRTGYLVTKHLAAPLGFASDYRMVVPLLVLFFAGELVWRERDAGLSENVDATSVPEWVLFLGKFLGLGLVLAALMGVLAAAGMLAQALMGYHDFQPGVYLQLLFGLQLPEYLLFAVLALLVQAVVNHKHVALLAALVAYFCIIFAPRLGIEHDLLVYGSGPEWSYTDMRGFGAVARAVAVVQALLGGVGAAAGGGGAAVLGARAGAGLRGAAADRAAPLHPRDGRRRRAGRRARPRPRRLHLLQHQRAQRIPHRLGSGAAAGRVRAALRAVRGDPAAGGGRHQAARGDLPGPRGGDVEGHVPPGEPPRGADRLGAPGAGRRRGDPRGVRPPRHERAGGRSAPPLHLRAGGSRCSPATP